MRCLVLILLVGMAAFMGNGCGRKADVELQVSELEKVFQNAGAAAANANESSETGAAVKAPSDVHAYVNAALSAVQSNDFAGGVIALQQAQRLPMMTAEQQRAVYETMQAMTADLVARADRGDVRAKAQLAVIERTRSQ